MKTRDFIQHKTIVVILLACLGLMFSLSSCRKDLEAIQPQVSQSDLKSMNDMKVTSDFNWSTYQEVQVNISVKGKAVVFIKSASSPEVVYEKAMALPNQVYSTIIAIPTYETELIISVNGIPNKVAISNNQVSCTF